MAETGAIIEYLVRVEGSAMLPLMLKLYVGRLGEAGKPLWPRIDCELKNHFDYMEGAVRGNDCFVANRFSAADIHLSFILDAGASRGPLSSYPRLTALHARSKARPAY